MYCIFYLFVSFVFKLEVLTQKRFFPLLFRNIKEYYLTEIFLILEIYILGIRSFSLYLYLLRNSICCRWVFSEYNRFSLILSLSRCLSPPRSARQTAGTFAALAFLLGQFFPLFVLTYISGTSSRKIIARMPDSLLPNRETSMIHFAFYRPSSFRVSDAQGMRTVIRPFASFSVKELIKILRDSQQTEKSDTPRK